MKKQRKHKISDAHPVIALIVNVIVGFILFLFVGSILEAVLANAFGIFPKSSGYPNVIGALILLFLYKLWYRPEFEGALKGGRPGEWLKLWIPIMISWLTVPFMFFLTPAQFGWPTFITVGTALAAGFMEETVFRSYALSTIMRKCRDGKLILTGAVLSSVIFGVVHGLNGLTGADPGSTGLQVIEAAFLGLFLAALYLRCGNLWPGIIVHSLNDIIAMTNVQDITENGVVTGGVTWWSGVDFVTCMIVGIIGLYMIRPAKRPEIMDIWSRKWVAADNNAYLE